MEVKTKEAAKQSITQPAGVKEPCDIKLAKRGVQQGRGGSRCVAVAVTKAPAPAPIRGGKAVRNPAKTPAARFVLRKVFVDTWFRWFSLSHCHSMNDFLWIYSLYRFALLPTYEAKTAFYHL